MDSFVNEEDFALLNQDHYTFEVLTRILKGECELIRSNHENLLLCHSESHYPVWIWTPDNATDEVKRTAWELACALRPLGTGYRYNLKYELAEYFIEKAASAGIGAGISMNLFVYDCPSAIPPDPVSDGGLYCCTTDDEEEAAAMIPHFYTEIGEEAPSYEKCLEKVRGYIAGKGFFFWKNKNGKTVACCSYKLNGRFASIGSVYTFPDERRKHYAQNLVYQVTRKVSEMGYIPMLYTDADYQASNACYEKIGYILRGKLCTVAIIN
ncbi:MAG: GNAT family N-acetyltransferase [Clostridia bacterium]|nr:GNAT family N-acetyltransferase [Clostridia bacterium]